MRHSNHLKLKLNDLVLAGSVFPNAAHHKIFFKQGSTFEAMTFQMTSLLVFIPLRNLPYLLRQNNMWLEKLCS